MKGLHEFSSAAIHLGGRFSSGRPPPNLDESSAPNPDDVGIVDHPNVNQRHDSR